MQSICHTESIWKKTWKWLWIHSDEQTKVNIYILNVVVIYFPDKTVNSLNALVILGKP